MYEISECLPKARRVLITLIILICSNTIKALPLQNTFQDVSVLVDENNVTIQHLFQSIEKQAGLSFIYDENDINLSKEIIITKGKYLLKDLLDKVTKQTGLQFIEKGNTILVKAGINNNLKKNESVNFI